MYTLGNLATLVALYASASAAPVAETSVPRPLVAGDSFTVPVIPNPDFQGFVASGPAARYKAYAKYAKGAIPADVTAAAANAAAKASSGSVPAYPEVWDTKYFCAVQIGTPGQTLNLSFDTGSSDFWVFSSDTPRYQSKGHKSYNPSSSSSSKQLKGASWSINYEDDRYASGSVYTDIVDIGGVSYPNQAVESAKEASLFFIRDRHVDGLVGLGFSSINTVTPIKQKTFFDNVKDSLAEPVFTVDLKTQAGGSYDFGKIDSSKYTGEITYIDVVTDNGYWEFNASGFAVGEGKFNDTPITAIADTGTTLLMLPPDIVDTYYAKVEGAKDPFGLGWVFPCDAKLPNFTFGIHEYRGVVPGEYINYRAVPGTFSCYGGIQSNNGYGHSTFGDILLKAQFVVFDGGKNRLGWAAKNL